MKRSVAVLVSGILMLAGGVSQAREAATVAAAPSITEPQRAMLDEKLARIAEIMRGAGAEQPGPYVSTDQQRWMLERLLRLPLAELRAMGRPGGVEAVTLAIGKARTSASADRPDAKALGNLATELVYIPLAPCRFIDTRNIGGQTPNNGTRGYDLDETGDTYGGSAACNPKAAVGGNANQIGAIFMNVTAIGSPFAPGFVGVRPTATSNTTSLVNWYQAGAGVQVANAAIVPINQSTTNDEIEFFGTQTHVVVDVMGVFAAPTPTALQCVTGTLTSVALNTVTRDYSLTASACPAGFTIVANSCGVLGADVANVRQSGGGVVASNDTRCIGRYEGSSTATVTNTPWCCRLPGRT